MEEPDETNLAVNSEGTGGASLLRSNEEQLDATTVGCTLTVGHTFDEANEHAQIAEMLQKGQEENYTTNASFLLTLTW